LHLANGDSKRMNDLVVGDQVYVMKGNEVITSPVLAIFRHYRSSIRFIDIYTTESSSPLRLTPLHSVLVLPKSGEIKHYSFAQNVVIGDFLFSHNLRLLKVTNIKEILIDDDNVYAPLTFEGSIVVNEIIASCYGTFSHSIMHILTTPIRWWYFILFHFSQLIECEHFQKLTSDLVVHFIDFFDCPSIISVCL
jgi:hedgehog protein